MDQAPEPALTPIGVGDESRPCATPIGQAIDRYLRHVAIERGLSANTLAAYRRDLGAYEQHLARSGMTSPGEVTSAAVVAFAHELRAREEAPLAASSVGRMLSSVRGFHRFLVEEGLAELDVSVDTKPPKLGMRLPKAISIEQVEALLAATDGDEVHQLRDKALLELLYATGARVSEAVDLNVDDVIEGDVVRLFGKGGKQRIVPVGTFARAALESYLVRARPVLSQRGVGDPRPVPRGAGQPTVAAERVADHPGGGRAGAARHRSVAAHDAALVRDAPARRRCRRARRAGAARPLVGRDDADLHARDRGHAAGHVHRGASARSLTLNLWSR